MFALTGRLQRGHCTSRCLRRKRPFMGVSLFEPAGDAQRVETPETHPCGRRRMNKRSDRRHALRATITFQRMACSETIRLPDRAGNSRYGWAHVDRHLRSSVKRRVTGTRRNAVMQCALRYAHRYQFTGLNVLV
ncbi:hypothetical protein [Caballeronia hypogeia]|uniref:hypothetical protein n=1 Tax=Caballeronia hypogeia TaxID=1777140 RepID=UPI0012FD06D7|nr:hypothetical protein [Caballeronia hypogeia]